ncbi:oxidoreductase [Mucilaginibacter ginkgonis]|uniref:SDR family NAD(P)-dependent oxidoreductase n=1 Tax=Mucilaginibacter ginkgonis TaxID=2682091 RepID=A0A6I4IML7_9SPHI|nr:oxidoreductase [Mucilaginibacter ginkgonis]QQL50419.1 SDR family NAD(P)-dependent oxidoreductase [Mucilaginibacter ginkgonis]
MEQQNNNPVWFITGCSTGFGRELVKLVLNRGWNAVITARDTEKVNELADGYAENALVLPLDVTDKGQVKSAIEQAQQKFGKIDVLVNNAGYGYFTSIEEGEEDKIRAQFETNVFGLINVTQQVLPMMRKQRSGHIVNISSIGGLRAFTATGYYHATKFAVEGFSESLSQEVASLGIKVLIVEPGPFRTDWAGRSTSRTETKLDDYKEAVGKRMDQSLAGSGKQVGDPVRGCEAIIKAVENPDQPLRLLLGEMAYNMAKEKVNTLTKNFDDCKELSISADFPPNER